MNIIETDIMGCSVFEYIKNIDDRGCFYRVFSDTEAPGFRPVQSSIGANTFAGTARGLHVQKSTFGEAKVISCISGSADLFVLDSRKISRSYGNIFTIRLSSDDLVSRSVFVPRFCSSGYVTIKDNTSILYYMDDYYVKEKSLGYNLLDSGLKLKYDFSNVTMSDRDRSLPMFSKVGGI